MQIILQQLKLKNFLSFSEATFNLANQGYCLIKGQNNCQLDNALSNGSGKSSWVSAISWCLTGQTIQGIKNNIANLFIPENECWVELTLKINDKNVKLIRYNKPKSDLKIFINGEDKSGKGIKESEEQLSILFPELTKELISSTILFGQGLPDKLSSLSPSGRKDLLEKLSKSDFMIQDIKKRVEERQNYLDKKQRELEDKILKLSTELILHENRIIKIDEEINNLNKANYDEDILITSNKLSEINNEIFKLNNPIKQNENLIEQYNENLLNINNQKQTKINTLNEEFRNNNNILNKNYTNILLEYNKLKNEINRLKNIKDICPTCGQKIPNIIKPDTSKQEQELTILEQTLNKANLEIQTAENNFKNENKKIEDYFKKDINEISSNLTRIKSIITEDKQNLNNLLTLKQSIEITYNKLILNKENLNNNLNNLKQEKENLNKTIIENKNNSKKLEEEKNIILERQTVIKKINTLIKRDFRGYLLTNIITYIDDKIKEYAKDVFGHNNIEFKLEGNNIEIYFNNKYYESLSGGEKTRVDLIVQFAIKSMLETYLGYSSNLLVLDECLDFLDQKSSEAVLNFIEKYSNSIESVFIISHHSESLDLTIDKEILIVKDNAGISSVIGS